MPLTDAQVRNAKTNGKAIKLTDGGGLFLEVRSTGSKLWRYRYRILIGATIRASTRTNPMASQTT